jgi:hypothetical protein
MNEEKFGFIYLIEGDYALRMGRNYYFLSDGISHIQTDVEVAGSIHDDKELKGYCLHINKLKKIWQIRDTGFKNCKDVLSEGKYEDGFEQSLKPFMKVFSK